MDKKALQSYAVWAKTNLESQIEVSLKTLGINSETDIKTARNVGEYTIIDGDSNSYPASLKYKRDKIVNLIHQDGYKQTIEEFAYTWFNRIVALRFMEVHDFLPHGFRVLSSRSGGTEPEILKNLAYVKDDLHLDMSVLAPLMEQGKLDEAFRYVLFRQCNSLSGILPMLFERDDDYLELLLPKALLKGETFITKLLEIGEDDFLNDVEVIGWLYQFYISQAKADFFASKKAITKETLPAATQLFTPDWIVRYMAENSVGRIWLESYPNSSLKSEMKYYVEDAKQDEETQRKIDEIKYKNVNPEDIRIIEPCCGSGHILVYVFDLLYKMYEEKGYNVREIPTFILKKNLVGLEIDKRAAQLASFSLIMKARSVNSRFFNDTYYTIPEIYEIWDSRALFYSEYKKQLEEMKLLSVSEMKEIEWLAETFRYAKTIGSLLKVEKKDFISIKNTFDKIDKQAVPNIFNSTFLNEGMKCLRHLLRQAEVMSEKYDVMITNPPYLSEDKMDAITKKYLIDNYFDARHDMYTSFIEKSNDYVRTAGFYSFVTQHFFMYLQSFSDFRRKQELKFSNLIDLGPRAFPEISGDVVQTVTFVSRNIRFALNGKYYDLRDCNDSQKKKELFLNEKSEKYYIRKSDHFSIYRDNVIAFNSTKKLDSIVLSKNIIGNYFESKAGICTGNDDYFIRYWFEINYISSSFTQKILNYPKYAHFSKGGSGKLFLGNIDYVIKINDLYDPKKVTKAVRRGDQNCYYKKGISWSQMGGGLNKRFSIVENCLCGTSSPTIYLKYCDENLLIYALAFLNSNISKHILKVLSPTTLSILSSDIYNLPFLIEDSSKNEVIDLTRENINIAKLGLSLGEENKEFETSFFKGFEKIKNIYDSIHQEEQNAQNKLKRNIDKIDEIFRNIYEIEIKEKLGSDLDSVIKLHDTKAFVKSLISYLIGVEMGRYSLDVDGLAYAGGEWNPMNYVTYQPDGDGIIPVYTQLGMADGLTARIIKLIKHIYGEDTYKENIDFIADALGKNNNESSEETLNRYLNDGFYADHLKTYQKRPIYWMFSSGKNNAFKCLVYLHRYTEDTLAIINSKYFLNESARLNHEVTDTQAQLESADGREKLRLEKLYKVLSARQKEMIDYGQVLDHMANQYIKLDLDDGVKVNYEKFQNIEVVNENGAKVKKDLLVPIK